MYSEIESRWRAKYRNL